MIRRLRLKNFKCFEDQPIDLRPLTVLSGVNGAGKSSVFQALLVLRQSYLQSFLPSRGLALNGDLVQIGTGKDVVNQNASKDDLLEVHLEFDTGATDSWVCRYAPEAEVLGRMAGENSEDYSHNLFTSDFQYLAAERVGPKPAFEMADYAVRNLRQLGSRGQNTVYFLAVYGKENLPCASLAHPDARSTQVTAQVEAWLEYLIPGVRLVIDEFRDMDLVRLQFQFAEGRDTSNLFRPTNVGFGITYALPIVVAAVAAKPGSVLLIENPEAHLHPRGQSRIGMMLAKAAACGIQVLIETHSDHVLNGIRLAVHDRIICPNQVAINFFERRVIQDRAHHTVVPLKIDSTGRIDHWPEGFFDEWDHMLDGLLAPPSERS